MKPTLIPTRIARPLLGATLASFALAGAATSAEEIAALPDPGHSSHGEVFNEGPRQAAVLISGTGGISMDVTTGSPEAREFFLQGLGQIHGFWDFEAERSFRQAAAIDPDFAMAYWGMAMANFKNDKRGAGFIAEAVARREGVSEEEQLWIDGLAAYFKDPKADAKRRLRDYVRSLEKLARAHPDSVEAKVFLLKHIYYNHGKDLPITSHYAVNLLAEEILATDPLHPANHYQIHLWDREDAAQALAAAARCGPSAPAIAHMWHMPGHIYSRLHRYDDAVWHMEASARVDHAHLMRYRILPDRIHNFAHNNEWLVRNLNALGQRDRSVALAENMISLPRLPKFKTVKEESVYDPAGSSWRLGRQRLRDTYVRFAMWGELVAASAEGGPLEPDGESLTAEEHYRYLGIAKFELGDRKGALLHLAALEERLAAAESERDGAVAKAEAKAREGKKAGESLDKAVEEAAEKAAKTFEKRIADLENPLRELRVYRALSDEPPHLDEALELLPELKNLAKWRHAELWHRAGDGERALKLAAEAVSGGKNEVLPLATHAALLLAEGKDDEAREVFEKLRRIAYTADLDLAAFASLAPLVPSDAPEGNWRLAPETPGDIGERPPLDSLGPFRWSPPEAPSFELADSAGETRRLEDHRGRPLLLVFYLGRGCAHCMEQLDAFAPLVEAYAETGIDLVAVSTDSVEGLARTFRGSGEIEAGDRETEGDETGEPFPFPLLSDEGCAAFRAYRAYDDFEDTPLHGTFLIDGEGRLRWHDIGYEPFMHTAWLLEESQRLLAYEAPSPHGQVVSSSSAPAARTPSDPGPSAGREPKG